MLRYLYDGTIKDFDDSQLTVLKVAKETSVFSAPSLYYSWLKVCG